jgi:hypothetical protein
LRPSRGIETSASGARGRDARDSVIVPRASTSGAARRRVALT